MKEKKMTGSELIEKAGLRDAVVSGKAYHSPLPRELEQFYCYVKDAGHCILVLLPSRGSPVEDYILPAPVKAVLKKGYTVKDGYVWSDLPYSDRTGLICDADDHEYDTNGGTDQGIVVVSNNGKLIESTNNNSSANCKMCPASRITL
jgi:hypothetical protein